MRHTAFAGCLLAGALALPGGAQTQIDLRTQGRNVDFSAAGSTKPVRVGTQLPPTCSVGELFFKSDATAGQNLYACTATNVWTLESGASGLPSMAGQGDKVISNNGTAADWRALGGDISGAPQAVTVGKIRGQDVGSTAPADGQVLRWNGASSQWQPYPLPATGPANYSQSFTNQTAVSMPGTAHGLGTASLIVECYNSASPSQRVEPDSVSVDQSTYDVTVAFTSPQSGRCVVNGSGGGYEARTTTSNAFAAGTVQTFQGALVATSADRTAPVKAGPSLPASCTPGDQFFKTDAVAGQNLYFCTGTNSWTQMSGGAPVASVFGRTGAVAAQSGDYNFSQIGGTAGDSQLAAGINANKIGAGAVGNAAFGYLANVSADIQGQLNGKAAASHSHVTGGDLAGSVESATVTRLQTRAVSTTAPADGQALVWSAAANTWQPATVSGGGGALMASQLNDLSVLRSSSNVLTIGANCSAGTPCNVRFGNVVYSLTNSCTATISAGTGSAYIYVASGGTLTIGHNASVSASAGCLAQPSVTSFPADSIPLYTWTATSGTWDTGGGHDVRAFLSAKAISAGTGITTVESAGRTFVAVDTATVPAYITGTAAINFPSIANGACAADQSFTLLGAANGDAVVAGWPTTLEPGLMGMMRVSAADTVAVRLCNLSGAAIDPASGTFRATIIRSF